MTQTTGIQAAARPYRLFTVEVRRLQRLSPTFLRVTFTGPDLDRFADNGYDQRIKLVLPRPGARLEALLADPDWYGAWRALPEPLRNPIRTYTTRAVRQHLREVDVDIVLHAHGGGPASAWASAARPGDRLALVGPDVTYPGAHGGVEFTPPPAGCAVLLAGDETAVPAVSAILEQLPGQTRGEALLEVPEPDDALTIQAPPDLRVTWLPREGAEHGSRLIPAVRAAAERLLPTLAAAPAPGGVLEEVDVDRTLLWEVPPAPDGDAQAPDRLAAWLAGEAGVIKTLRRHLVTERGLDRRAVAFMGYWRRGRSEDAL